MLFIVLFIISLTHLVKAQTFPGTDITHDYKLDAPGDMDTFYTTSTNGIYYARSYKRLSDGKGVIEMYTVNNITNELVLDDTIVQPADSASFANGDAGNTNDKFGQEIEVWGIDMLGVASPNNGAVPGTNSGKAFFYRRDSNGDWVPHAVWAHVAGGVSSEYGYYNRHMVACETSTQYVLHTLSYEYAQYFYTTTKTPGAAILKGAALKTDNLHTGGCYNAAKLTVDQSTCQYAFAYYSQGSNCGVIKYRLGPGVSSGLPYPKTGAFATGAEGQSDFINYACNYDANKLYIPYYGSGTARSYIQMIGIGSGSGTGTNYVDYPDTKTLHYDVAYDDLNTVTWPFGCEYYPSDDIMTSRQGGLESSEILYTSGFGTTTGPIDASQYRLVHEYTGVTSKSIKKSDIRDNQALLSLSTGESYYYATVIPPTPSPTVSPTPAPTFGGGGVSVTITYDLDSEAYSNITQDGLDSGDFIDNLANQLGIGAGNITISAINGQLIVEIAVVDPDPDNEDPLGEDLLTQMQEIESEISTIKSELLAEIDGLNSNDILFLSVDYCGERDCSGFGDNSISGTNENGCLESTGVCQCTQNWGINCETPCTCENGRECKNNICHCEFPEYGLRCHLNKTECQECLIN